MTQLTNNLQGNEEPVHAEESRGTAARLTDDAHASKKGNQKGLGSPKPCGDKIASKLVANVGKNQTLSPSPAMADLTHNLQGNQVPLHAEVTRASEEHRIDYTRGAKDGNRKGLASPKLCGDKIASKLVANVGKNQTLSPSPAMADLTHNLQGNQVPLHAEVTRASEEHRTDYTRGAKNGNKQGLASPKLCGDKIANKAMTNFGKNSALSPTPAMDDHTDNLPGNQVPLLAKAETRASEKHRSFYRRGSKNGNNQGLLLPKPRGNRIANKVTTNKKMDDRVKNWNQLNAERLGAVLARWEQKRAWGKPPPKRGDVKKAIVEAGVQKIIDTGKAFCCVPGPFDADAFVRDLPFPTRSEPTATLWAKVEL